MGLIPLQDIETQIKGVVMIYYGVDQTQKHDDRSIEFLKNWISIPWKNVAFHVCMSPTTIMSIPGVSNFFQLFHNRNVCRSKLHTGTFSDRERFSKLTTSTHSAEKKLTFF